MIGRPRASSPWRVSLLNLVILLVILIPCAVGVGVFGWAQHKMEEVPQDVVPDGALGIMKVMEHHGTTFNHRDSMNILVLGIDYNWTDSTHLPYSAGARSDTMFVLHLSKEGNRLGMLTIPRDMYIVYPNGTHDKINGAYSDGGVPLARKTIEQFLGIHIDHYVVLKIQGTARLIDALGGLKINVEKDMSYDDNWGYLHVHLKKGWQHLNGMQAVGYARFRHDAESDFGRIRRQQQIVDTLIQQLKKPENFNLQKLQELAGLFRKYVSTDLNVPQMVDLAWVYQSFDRRNMIAGYIPGDDGWVGDMSVLTPPDKGTIRKMVRRVLVGTGEWQVADVTTEVLNGSNVPMAATALGKTLTNQGDSVVRAVDWQGAHPPNSIILLHSSNPKLEKVARQLVPGLPVVHDADYPLGGDQGTAKSTLVSIILGDDWGGLQSATPSLAPTPCSSGQPNATVTVLPPTRSDTYTAAPGAPPEAMSPGAVLAPCRRGPSTPQR